MRELITPLFSVGQVVEMKSGSPKMTIIELIHKPVNPYKPNEETYFTGNLKCQWYENCDSQPVKVFNQDLLRLADTN